MVALADLLHPFCEAASISIKTVCPTTRKRILVSLAFLQDKKQLHDTLFPSQHMDWPGVTSYLASVVYTPADWMLILGLLDFVNEEPPRAQVLELINTAVARSTTHNGGGSGVTLTPLDSLRICFAKAKLTPTWDLLCKTLLICNLTHLDHQAGLQLLLADTQKTADVLRYLLAYRHTPAEYDAVFATLLHESRCQVRSHLVLQSIRKREALRASQKHNATVSGLAFKRPSLTAILEAKRQREGTLVASQDSLPAFCIAARIASNANTRLKQVAYFLACMPDHEQQQPSARSEQMLRVLGGDQNSHRCAMAITIVRPDLKAMREIVASTTHTGAPFDDLRHFREACVAGRNHKSSWTLVLRLYMAAYCRPEVCKDLWHSTNGVGSNNVAWGEQETENAVLSFTRTHRMAVEEVVTQMLLS